MKNKTVVGIKKNELRKMIASWELFARCFFWELPEKEIVDLVVKSKRGQHNADVCFNVGDKPVRCTIDVKGIVNGRWCCERTVVVNGNKRMQGLRYLKSLLSLEWGDA